MSSCDRGHDYLREGSGLKVCTRCGHTAGSRWAGKQPGRSFADGLDEKDRTGRYEMLEELVDNPYWLDDRRI